MMGSVGGPIQCQKMILLSGNLSLWVYTCWKSLVSTAGDQQEVSKAGKDAN